MSGHRIEQAVRVNLVFDGTAWQIDHASVDGHPLDPLLEDGPSQSECRFDHIDDTDALRQCDAEHDRACDVEMPTGDELVALLLTAIRSRDGGDDAVPS